MSSIEKDIAIALDVLPFSETSCIVSWMTESHGRLRTLVKGAQRAKGGWLGSFDVFFTSEIIFYFRAPQALHVLKECDLIVARHILRKKWRATAAASYIAGLVADICLIEAPQPEIFSLFNHALDDLADCANPETAMAQIELQLMTCAGIAPQFNTCVQCLRPIHARQASDPATTQASQHSFSPCRGGLLCHACSQTQAVHDFDLLPIGWDLLEVLRKWQESSAHPANCAPPLLREALRVMGLFLRHHLEGAIPCRIAALEIIRHGCLFA